MKTVLLAFILCLTTLSFAQTPNTKVVTPVRPMFVIKKHPEKADGMPSSTVSVILGKTNTTIAKITGTAENIGKSEFSSKEIPAKAIAACGAWWAGAGDYFYVIQKGTNYLVYSGWQSEEQTEKGFHWKQVRVLKP